MKDVHQTHSAQDLYLKLNESNSNARGIDSSNSYLAADDAIPRTRSGLR